MMVGQLLAIAAATGEANDMTVESFGVWFRDWLNARDARHLSRSATRPETVEKQYWHDTEFSRDSTRLAALGYTVASEIDNEPYIGTTLPAVTGVSWGI